MNTVKEWENYLYNLKDGDLPFLNEKKFDYSTLSKDMLMKCNVLRKKSVHVF
jgi:hypothetical protein